jgi:hypothetical protein
MVAMCVWVCVFWCMYSNSAMLRSMAVLVVYRWCMSVVVCFFVNR